MFVFKRIIEIGDEADHAYAAGFVSTWCADLAGEELPSRKAWIYQGPGEGLEEACLRSLLAPRSGFGLRRLVQLVRSTRSGDSSTDGREHEER